jgi:hypothetical protein
MQHWKWATWALLPLLIFLGPGSAAAGSVDQVTVDISIFLVSSVTLTLTPNTINFPDANPGTTPSIPATQSVSVTCQINASGSSSWTSTLDVQATGNLISGGNSIPINMVSWTATGAAGYKAGTMSTTSVQAGQWTSSRNKTFSGTFSYSLQNSWSYATGNYTTTAIYTLHSP